MEPDAEPLRRDAAVPAPSRSWLDDEQQRAWRAYIRGSRLLNEALDLDLQTHGVNLPDYEILAMLSEAPPEGLRMSRLADQIVHSRSRLTHTAIRLERRGYVRRARIAGDGRAVGLSLTSQGRDLVDRVAPAHLASVRAHLVDVLTREELRVLGKAMHRVRATILNLDPDNPRLR